MNPNHRNLTICVCFPRFSLSTQSRLLLLRGGKLSSRLVVSQVPMSLSCLFSYPQNTTCSGFGTCLQAGGCVCQGYVIGAACNQCPPGMFGLPCQVCRFACFCGVVVSRSLS